MGINHSTGATDLGQPQRFRRRTHHQIAAYQRVAFTGGNPYRSDIFRPVGKTAVDMDRTALLRQPGHFHHACTLAIDLSRLRQNCADGHDPGATHPGDHHIKGTVDVGQNRFGHLGQIKLRGLRLADLRALQRYERRTKAFNTAEIFIAGGLINRPFAPQLGFDRSDRHTV